MPTNVKRKNEPKNSFWVTVYIILYSRHFMYVNRFKTTRYQSYTCDMAGTPTLGADLREPPNIPPLAAPMDENTSDAKKINTEK